MAEVELPKPEELHEQAENRFSRRVALVTALFAVVLAIAALGGNHAMKEMLLAQQQSSDQWAFYQAKVIREHLYRAQRMRLEADLADRAPAAAREKLRCSATVRNARNCRRVMLGCVIGRDATRRPSELFAVTEQSLGLPVIVHRGGSCQHQSGLGLPARAERRP